MNARSARSTLLIILLLVPSAQMATGSKMVSASLALPPGSVLLARLMSVLSASLVTS